ncbi:hypothetical protein AN958_04634 [Leucoagaricus sp. SymC.cos]|nr:hypothetical protein AN958_04634 [Leucoagaricus sp. SymC.cos]
MPRVQSPPRGTRAHSRVSPLASKPNSKQQDLSTDVLELTSGDDIPNTPLPQLRKHHKRVSSLTTKKKPRQKLQNAPLDVIEISSDEDEASPSQGSIIADLRGQVKKLEQEKEKCRNERDLSVQEALRYHAQLKEANAKASEQKSTDGKLVLDPSALEDGLSCEICTGRMYTPYLLPDCGHTFCLSCLRDWFGTAHARFLQANPHWHQNTMNGYISRIQALLLPEYLAHPQLHFHLQQLQQPVPEYTCPTCRKRVYRRPVEVYALKSLVRTISAANRAGKGDIPLDQPFAERRHGHLVVADPWDGYFPRER